MSEVKEAPGGKKDKSGMALPNNLTHKPPKKTSEIVDKQTKNIVKRKLEPKPDKIDPKDNDEERAKSIHT